MRRIEAIAAGGGLLFLTVAGATIAVMPLISVGCSLAAVGLGLCIRRQAGAQGCDYLQLSRVALLSGGGMLALSLLCFHFDIMRPGFESLVSRVLRAFGGFLSLIKCYTLFCFFGFLIILASQKDRAAPA